MTFRFFLNSVFFFPFFFKEKQTKDLPVNNFQREQLWLIRILFKDSLFFHCRKCPCVIDSYVRKRAHRAHDCTLACFFFFSFSYFFYHQKVALPTEQWDALFSFLAFFFPPFLFHFYKLNFQTYQIQF